MTVLLFYILILRFKRYIAKKYEPRVWDITIEGVSLWRNRKEMKKGFEN
ncbi:MAG: hypothetical protein ACFFAS_05880 [Promethearchaeota archaeon]